MTGNDALDADVWGLGPAGVGRRGAVPPEMVGVKANGLIRMAQQDSPVPPGFVLSTRLCRRYHREGRQTLADAAALAARFRRSRSRPVAVSVAPVARSWCLFARAPPCPCLGCWKRFQCRPQ